MPDHPAALILAWFVMPVWILAGLADWLCHRATDIEHTGGVKESMLHIVEFGSIGIPLLLVLFLDVNALVFTLALVLLVVHHAAAAWDVSYAVKRREVPPVEQHVHGVLEMLPITALLLLVVLHWDQFLALFGAGDAPARFALEPKRDPLPVAYVAGVLVAASVFAAGPFVEELWRCWRARRETPKAKGAVSGPLRASRHA